MAKKRYTGRMIKMRMQLSVGYHLFRALIMADKLSSHIERASKEKARVYEIYKKEIQKLVQISDDINRYLFLLPDEHPIKQQILFELEGEKVEEQV